MEAPVPFAVPGIQGSLGNIYSSSERESWVGWMGRKARRAFLVEAVNRYRRK